MHTRFCGALTAWMGARTSGGHVNPAVTLGLAATGKFPWSRVPLYVGAQLGGAILAALAAWLSFGDQARDQAKLGATALASGVSAGQGFVVAALITFVLAFVVVLVASDPRVPSSRKPRWPSASPWRVPSSSAARRRAAARTPLAPWDQ